LEDSKTTRVATLGIGEDGEWPVLQFEEGGRSWSLKPSVLPSLVTALNHISIYYGWKRVGVVEDRMEASLANSGSSLNPGNKTLGLLFLLLFFSSLFDLLNSS
jgi:hypothetical protein